MPPLLHPLPSRAAVAREQFRTVGLSLRREALVGAGLLAAFTAWVASVQLYGFESPRLDLVPDALLPLVVLAPFAALAVWKSEDPARRGYHWSMPVDHERHAVVKALSGLGWLMIAGVLFSAWMLGMVGLTGGTVGVESRALPSGMVTEQVAAWRWLVPFAAAAALYGFGTALALATRHPWRWIGGGLVGFTFLNAWVAAMGTRTSLHVLTEAFWESRLGLVTLTTGTSLSYPGRHWGYQPDVEGWAAASVLWLGAAAAAVALAARYQRRG